MRHLDLAALLRMGERLLIVVGGILAIYLGYQLFVLGIDVAQGEAQAFGIALRDFGPGLFFAALGTYILVRTLSASIKSEMVVSIESQETIAMAKEEQEAEIVASSVSSATTFFFGIEDPSRQRGKWSAKSFFLETRDLLRQMESEDDSAAMEVLKGGLEKKLESITMTTNEYQQYQVLTNKADLSVEEQQEFLNLEGKLFP